MKNTYCIKLLFLSALLIISCDSTEGIEEIEYVPTVGELTTFSVDRNQIFTDSQANLIIDVDSYSEIQVSSNNNDVTITKVDDLNYTITSSVPGTELINITVLKDTGDQLKGVRRMYFHEHGTTDYNTVEGIVIDTDLSSKVLSLHGEPEGKSNYTTTGDNPITYEYWYYFSKGFYFTVHQETGTVVNIKIYTGYNWIRTIDNVPHTGSLYPYGIDGFSKQNTTENILMDNIIEKYGEPESKNESSSSTSTLKWYVYNDLNTAVSGTQKAVFYFFSSDVNDYTNKTVSYVIID